MYRKGPRFNIDPQMSLFLLKFKESMLASLFRWILIDMQTNSCISQCIAYFCSYLQFLLKRVCLCWLIISWVAIATHKTEIPCISNRHYLLFFQV